jgi:hypothetical protein
MEMTYLSRQEQIGYRQAGVIRRMLDIISGALTELTGIILFNQHFLMEDMRDTV